jgi:type I restriction enzyme S subunit
LVEQQIIARVLGSLDDKIELHRRMNQTLDATALAIFKAGFVDFEVTQDEAGTIQDLAEIGREIINPSDYPDTLFEHYSIPAFDAGKIPYPEKGSSIRSAKLSVPPGAVLLSKLNPRIPRVWLPSVDPSLHSICSTEFLVVSPKEFRSTKEFLYSLFCSSEFMDRFASRTTGTSGSHQRVRAEDLLRLKIQVPAREVCEQYSTIVRPVFEKAARNVEESRTLATLRDFLLPKLLSGEIRVRDAEKIAESAL